MKLYILDREFNSLKLVDYFTSIIWTDRYCDVGEFDIRTPVDSDILQYAKRDYYIWSSESDRLMIIEDLIITTDVVQGNQLQIRGRSLESILDRRILWEQTQFNDTLENVIKKALDENIISPKIDDRKIPNFIFQYSNDPDIAALKHKEQMTGDNLLDMIKELCGMHDLGFKVTLNSDNQFVFQIFKGIDRSFNQDTNPYVIFSPKRENIINSNYLESTLNYRNVALVAGEDLTVGEEGKRKTLAVGSGKGLDRRELFVDARDIQSEKEGTDGEKYTDEEYDELLKKRGEKKLSERKVERLFDGEIEATQLHVYGKDFFLGDVVQIINEFGIEAVTRITEIATSVSPTETTYLPTFSVVTEDENES